jgi:hypothetical protein
MTKLISRRCPYVLSFNYGILITNSAELKVFCWLKQAARQTTYTEWRNGSYILNRCSRWQLEIGREVSPVPTEREFESATDSVCEHRREKLLYIIQGLLDRENKRTAIFQNSSKYVRCDIA